MGHENGLLLLDTTARLDRSGSKQLQMYTPLERFTVAVCCDIGLPGVQIGRPTTKGGDGSHKQVSGCQTWAFLSYIS
jgi:hypothetical protein